MARTMTPTGRQQTDWGNPPGRPPGPTQHLIPVGPPPTYSGQPIGPNNEPIVSPRGIPRGTVPRGPLKGQRIVPSDNISATAHQMLVGLPRINSPLIDPATANTAIPWTQFLTNLWRLVQPTGITPGTFAGITFNVFGQAIAASSSGFTLDSPVLIGTPTAPTPPANDNSTRIATTAWVQGEGFLRAVGLAGDVTGSGGANITTTLAAIHGRPVPNVAPAVGQALIWNGAGWVPGQAGIPDAPADGQIYARQNGAWVRLSQAIIPPV